jgi:hypothetical protein
MKIYVPLVRTTRCSSFKKKLNLAINCFPLAFFQWIKQTSQSQDFNFLLMHNLQPPLSSCPRTNHSIPLAWFNLCFQIFKNIRQGTTSWWFLHQYWMATQNFVLSRGTCKNPCHGQLEVRKYCWKHGMAYVRGWSTPQHIVISES